MSNEENSVSDNILAQWMTEHKRLLLALLKRQYLMNGLCPSLDISDDDRSIKLRRLSEINDTIDLGVEKMREIEHSTPAKFGCMVLLGDSTSNTPLYLAACALIGARLNSGFRIECKTVGDISSLTAGTCAMSALIIRDGFRVPDGVLFPWTRLSNEFNLDQCHADLSDLALSLVCGRIPSDREYAMSILRATEATPIPKRHLPF